MMTLRHIFAKSVMQRASWVRTRTLSNYLRKVSTRSEEDAMAIKKSSYSMSFAQVSIY